MIPFLLMKLCIPLKSFQIIGKDWRLIFASKYGIHVIVDTCSRKFITDKGSLKAEFIFFENCKRIKKEAQTVKDLSPLKDTVNTYLPAIHGSRSIESFQSLRKIEEGAFGVVYKAKDKRTDEIVALKRLKILKENEGFPTTSLREIKLLQKIQHLNIVQLKEVIVGTDMNNIYIVMDFIEHDLKSVMKNMEQPFSIGEVKTLMIQLLSGVSHLHSNWVIHRDLKLSNLLLSQNGVLKIADFGLAREYGDPLKAYTPLVVTLWYRAPELLQPSSGKGSTQKINHAQTGNMGHPDQRRNVLPLSQDADKYSAKMLYSTPIDIWSVGCIFGELIAKRPLFPGESEIDQLKKIIKKLGPLDQDCSSKLPSIIKSESFSHPLSNLKSSFDHKLTDLGLDLLYRFLIYDPSSRITADDALNHDFFNEEPSPVSVNMLAMSLPQEIQSSSFLSHGKHHVRQKKEAKEGLKVSAGFTLKF